MGLVGQGDAARGRRRVLAEVRPHVRVSGDEHVLRARSPPMMPIRAFSYMVRHRTVGAYIYMINAYMNRQKSLFMMCLYVYLVRTGPTHRGRGPTGTGC